MSTLKSANRRVHDDAFKAKVVLEALREQIPLTELASKYELAPVQISHWKAQFLDNMPSIFTRKNKPNEEAKALKRENERLVHQIGEQAVDIDFLKKSLKKLGLL
jgi:transposase-like protein